MLKRRAILTSVATLVALVVAGFLVWRSSPEFRINIEQSEIQSRVSAKLSAAQLCAGGCLVWKS